MECIAFHATFDYFIQLQRHSTPINKKFLLLAYASAENYLFRLSDQVGSVTWLNWRELLRLALSRQGQREYNARCVWFTEAGACEPCRPDCASCEGSSNRCTRCGPRLLLHDRQCWLNCPEHTYQFNQRSVEAGGGWGVQTGARSDKPLYVPSGKHLRYTRCWRFRAYCARGGGCSSG